MGTVIALSGIDGSGKSWQAQKLALRMKSEGLSVKILWMRGYGKVFFSFPMLFFCRLVGITRVHNLLNGKRVSEYRFYLYKPISLLWPWLQYSDALLYSKISAFLSKNFDVTIMDRNAIDMLVDVLLDTNFPSGSRLIQLLFKSLLPKGLCLFVLDIGEEVAAIRKNDILNLSYLKARREMYQKLAHIHGWPLISTEKDAKEVQEFLYKQTSNERYKGKAKTVKNMGEATKSQMCNPVFRTFSKMFITFTVIVKLHPIFDKMHSK
jgi:hypothetical protein